MIRISAPARRRLLRLLLLAGLTLAGTRTGFAQQPGATVSGALLVETSRVYVGQRFTLTLSLRARGVTLGQQFNLNGLPSGDVLRLGPFQQLPVRQDAEADQLVAVHEFRCEAEARQGGGLTVAPTLDFEILSHERGWFGSTTFRSAQRLDVTPLVLTVLPLPLETQPADFSGAVGRFTLTVDAAPREVAVGDLVTLSMQVSGDGALTGFSSPLLASNTAFRVYEAKEVQGAPAGSRRFEQIVIPLSSNAVVTPDVRFVSFDPNAARYVTAVAPGQPLRFHARSAAPVFTPYRPADPAAPETASARAADAEGAAQPPAALAPSPLSTQAPLVLAVVCGALLLLALWMVATAMRLKGGNPREGQWWGLLLLLVALAGLGVAWRLSLVAGPVADGMVSTSPVELRLAPSLTAQSLGALSVGSRLQVTEHWQDWLRVATDGREGWIPAHATAAP